jgi:DNA topoisomerase I
MPIPLVGVAVFAPHVRERWSVERSDPQASATQVGLRHVGDDQPGYRRRRYGGGFQYLAPDGTLVRDPAVQRRLRQLAIPPAWIQVWICANPRGHLQATGRDARGRKQYIYHPDFQEIRSQTKYDRLAAFAGALPRLRRRVARDLRRRRLSRERVVALVVHLLDILQLRVGNTEYARANASFGLTTLRDDHLRIRGDQIRFAFKGKSGVRIEVGLRDRRVARLLKQLQDLPGQEVFQYLDDRDRPQTIDSQDVNDYLRQAAGADYSAKDLRTWNGTVLAAQALCGLPPADTAAERKRLVREAVVQVASRLHNTPTVCRKYYIHPRIFEAYETGLLCRKLQSLRPAERVLLSAEERAVARLLAGPVKASR